MVGLSDYRPRQAMSPAMRTFGRKTPAQMAQQQLDDHAYFRDQTHDLKMGAIQQPYSQNAATYGSMGVPTQQKMGLRDYASKIQSGMRPGLRLGPEQVTPSQSALLAGRGGDYGPDPRYPDPSRFAYTGGLPNGAANDRRYQSNAEFVSSTGNGSMITSMRDAQGRVGLYGTPQEAPGVKLSSGDGVLLKNGVGVNPETGSPVYAQGLQAYFARNAARDQESKARRVLAMAAQNGVPMNSPLLRAAQARLGVSPEMKRFQEMAMQTQLQQMQHMASQNASIQDEIHKTRLSHANGQMSTDAAQQRINRLQELLTPEDVFRQGLTPSKRKTPMIGQPEKQSLNMNNLVPDYIRVGGYSR